MATITPAVTIPSATNVPVVTWTGVATANTMLVFVFPNPNGLAAGVQLSGTWGGSTVILKGSVDGSTYFTLKDINGTAISATADAYFEFTTSCPYIKPTSSGGAGDTVNVIICARA